jgi:NADH-quinone oxidoreductase subunit G
MPKLTIDGREVEADAGTTILQASLAQGAEIPHYCYHPALSIAGNCRMCLVEVEKAPKLVIACATPVADGMVVHTGNERVKRAQAAIMEFLLINHPLDCTICDEAGECRLQEYAFEYGKGRSRYEHPKVLLAKAIDVGEHVMLDQERCIQCSRCVRFCDEVTGTSELAFFQRGDRTIIGIYPGRRLDNLYSGNTVDICPVGALTLKEFRFLTRVWYLKNTPSICAGCARGCNVFVATGRQREMWTTTGQFDERIKRIVPRHNAEVNGHWICDEGRLSYLRLEAAPRLQEAGTPAGATSWEEAVRLAAESLVAAARAGRAAAIVSPRLTSESMFAWRKLFEQLGGVRVGVRRIERGADDDLLIRADKGANSLGASWIFGEPAPESAVHDFVARGGIDVLLLLGDVLDPEDSAALPGALRASVRETIYVGPFRDRAAEQATIRLPACAWSEEEGSVVNFQGRVQWVRRCHVAAGEARPGWRVVLDLAAAAGVELPAWSAAADVLAALAREAGPYAGLDVDRLGLLGAPGGAAAGAGASGERR